MAVQITSNNAKATLASGITSGATSLTLATGKGALFPALSGGDWLMLTLTQAVTETSWEIVKVTARSGDVLTIVRAQEGTTAAAWATADKAELRLTAGLVNRLATLDDAQAFTGQKTLTNPVINGFSGDTSAINIGSGQIVKDTAGNLGIGVTPSAWTGYKALQIGNVGALWGNPGGYDNFFSSNYYFASSDKYMAASAASYYRQYLGSHRWAVAPSGTPGAAITWTPVMVADANGIGYPTGAGGTVTQPTSRSTSVTINKPTGRITMASAAGSATWSYFIVNNSLVSTADTVSVSLIAGSSNSYLFQTSVAAGSFAVLFATTGGTATDAPQLQFNVHKGATS